MRVVACSAEYFAGLRLKGHDHRDLFLREPQVLVYQLGRNYQMVGDLGDQRRAHPGPGRVLDYGVAPEAEHLEVLGVAELYVLYGLLLLRVWHVPVADEALLPEYLSLVVYLLMGVYSGLEGFGPR